MTTPSIIRASDGSVTTAQPSLASTLAAPRTLVSARRYTTISALANPTSSTSAPAQLRTAKHYGRDHLIIPVVALRGNVVVRPLGSSGPEFVPASELALAPASWNRCPIVMNHPQVAGVACSANDPTILEAYSFGSSFNTQFTSDLRLQTEAWIDLERVPNVSEAQDVVARCQAGEPVEVSVGAFVTVYEQAGTWEGQEYQFVWERVIPDHIAMLSRGVEGACSVEMGCGAPRIMRSNHATKNEEGNPMRSGVNDSFMTRMRQLFGTMFRSAIEDEGLSGHDLRSKLSQALYAVEPAFWGVEDFYPESQTVIYATYPADKLLLYRRSYQVDEAGIVSLNDDRETVQPIDAGRKYITVAVGGDNTTSNEAINKTATTETTALASDCTCHSQTKEDSTLPLAKKELIARLIAAKRSPFKETDTKLLEGMSDEHLKSLDTVYAEEKPDEAQRKDEKSTDQPASPAQTPSQQSAQQPVQSPSTPQTASTPPASPASADAVQLSRDEYTQMKAAADAFSAQQAQRKQSLVSTLTNVQSAFPAPELTAMSIDQLEKLVTLANANRPRDYSTQTFVPPVTTENKHPEIPDPYDIKGLQAKYKEGGH